MVVFKCRQESTAMKECLASHASEEKFREYFAMRSAEVLALKEQQQRQEQQR